MVHTDDETAKDHALFHYVAQLEKHVFASHACGDVFFHDVRIVVECVMKSESALSFLRLVFTRGFFFSAGGGAASAIVSDM